MKDGRLEPKEVGDLAALLHAASGAPCFNSRLEPIALHQARSGVDDVPRGAKVGVLLSSVLRDLETHGLGPRAQTPLV